MVTEDGAIAQALCGLTSLDRRGAGVEAARLAGRLEFLTWSDRAAILDEVYWGEARARLRHELITAVINRRMGDPGSESEVELYASYCRAVTTAVLLTLGEPLRVEEVAAAWSYRLSLLGEHQEAAEAWLGARHHEEAARELARRPGHAFLVLTLSPNDSAESFMARDAFFAAMLGRS